MVKGNSHRFKQVIVYFTSNAFKQSRSVKVDLNLIRTKDRTSTIELQVQDSGPGMSEEELDVFQSFSRLSGVY
jgi:signal transduction histidine kinase